ncbi:OmpA family protein [Enterobacteriaceae bacterium LUAb1]
MKKQTLQHILYITTTITILIFFVTLYIDHNLIIANVLFLVLFLFISLIIVLQCRYELSVEPITIKPTCPLVSKYVVLIIGPYAEKWFNSSENTYDARYSSGTAFLLISNISSLKKRLKYIDEHHLNEQVIAFFPFLPDGHETATLIMSQLAHWRTSLTEILAERTIPCTFAIYARLSDERRRNNRDNASWIGEIILGQQPSVKFDTALKTLRTKLAVNNFALSEQIQRAAMSNILLNWLEESGIKLTLEEFFASPSLQLTNVILCDYGRGFSRHGAWSGWLEQKFSILPALGSGISLPPMPPLQDLPQTSASKKQIICQEHKKLPRVLWSIWLSTVLLVGSLIHACWLAKGQQRTFYQEMAHYNPSNISSIQQLQENLHSLETVQNKYRQYKEKSLLLLWGFSPYTNFIDKIQKKIAQLNTIPTFSSSEQSRKTLFDSGSSRLKPESSEQLQEVLSLAKQYPHNTLLIVGHSDNTGNEAMNFTLAEQRATVVSNWLQQHDIPASRLRVKAVGATEPVASNDNIAGREKNRRVEILILPINTTKDGV